MDGLQFFVAGRTLVPFSLYFYRFVPGIGRFIFVTSPTLWVDISLVIGLDRIGTGSGAVLARLPATADGKFSPGGSVTPAGW